MPATDQEIDALIDQQKPNLRTCYRAMFEQNQPYVALNMGKIELPNGGFWDVMMLWAAEPMAQLIQGTLGGYLGLGKSLMDLPESLKERLGPHPLAEALEIVEAELAPEVIKQWKHPAKRLKFLTVLKSDLEYSHRHYLKLDNARRKRVSKRMRVIFSREPKAESPQRRTNPGRETSEDANKKEGILMPATDQEIDALIDQQKPNLRTCYRAMFEQNQPYVALNMGKIELPNGGFWDVMMLWAAEPMAQLIQGTLGGYLGLGKSLAKAQGQPAAPPAQQPASSAFGI